MARYRVKPQTRNSVNLGRTNMVKLAYPFNLLATALLWAALLGGCVSGGGSDTTNQVINTQSADNPTAPRVPVLKWSQTEIWAGKPPAAGNDITIPAGVVVVLDTTPPELSSLNIMGTLVFADDKDISLTAKAIMVHGKLQIGTETQPYKHRAVITLTGNDPTVDMMGMGTKVLGTMMGGTIEMHGNPVSNSWTRLAQTAKAGATTLTLQDAPTWQPGDQLVVASTDQDPAKAEVVTIGAISNNIITLLAPLKFPHYADTAKDSLEGAEVGILSHNIVIQGDASSSQSRFGGHIIIQDNASAKLENVELKRVGQSSRADRYPINFLVTDGSQSYVKNISIHQAFNRCITAQGSQGLSIEGNVAYDTVGHCYVLSDGAETNNKLIRNLGILTKRPKSGEEILPSEISATGPATFWISNPSNIIRGNVAAGSEGSGFGYSLPAQPTGRSALLAIAPRSGSVTEFSNNLAHSNIANGLFTDNRSDFDGITQSIAYDPMAQANLASLTPYEANINVTTYNNGDDFEVGVCTHFGQYTTTPESDMDIMNTAGITSFRDDFYWSRIERSIGNFNLPADVAKVEKAVNLAKKLNRNPILILDYGNTLYDGGGLPLTDAAQDAFVRYVEYVVNRFKGRIHHYEVWNEWNIGMAGNGIKQLTGSDAVTYAKLLQKVYVAIKKIDPSITVLAGAVTSMDTAWIRTMMDQGAASFMDGLSVHPYNFSNGKKSTPEYAVDWLIALEGVLKPYANGKQVPIYVTEMGWPTHTGPYGISPALAADYSARFLFMTKALPFVKGVWMYDFRNDGTDPANKEHNFGLMQADSTPKPTYSAIQIVNDYLKGARYIGRMASSSTVRVLKFLRADNTEAYAMWTTTPGAQGTVSITNGLPEAQSFQIQRIGTPPQPMSAPSAIVITNSPTILSAKSGQLTLTAN